MSLSDHNHGSKELIVAGLSALIAQHSAAYNSEYCHPVHDSDQMDETIAYHKKKVLEYRALRQCFENVAYTMDGIEADKPK